MFGRAVGTAPRGSGMNGGMLRRLGRKIKVILRQRAKAITWTVCAAAFLGVAIYFLPIGVAASVQPDIYSNMSYLPAEPVGVVLGAGANPDGSLSSVLKSRVDTAVSLYKAHKVQRLLMSDDNGRANNDVPTAMKAYAVAHGVPAAYIMRDYAGLHTYDSCYRAKHIFGITRAVVVSQSYHLPQVVYVARALGINAVGMVAPDNAPAADVAALRSRERLTTLGELYDLATHHKPRYDGPPQEALVQANYGSNS